MPVSAAAEPLENCPERPRAPWFVFGSAAEGRLMLIIQSSGKLVSELEPVQ